MNDENLKILLGTNIANLRKRNGMTQAGLAEQLNFSDKAVSKWERGESMPDVPTLMRLAELFDVTVDDLLKDPSALPEDVGKVEKAMGKAVEKTLKRKANKRIIAQLCTVLVWFVALFLFVVLSSCDIPNSWLGFVFAVPISALVQLCLRSAWRDFRSNRMLISVMMWGFLIGIYLCFPVLLHVNPWKILLLGIPGQIAILLWFKLRKSGPEE